MALVALGLLAAAAFAWWRSASTPAPAPRSSDPVLEQPQAAADFVGAAVCAECHAAQTSRWRESMHARAMAMPSATTVAAPFAGESFALHGLASTFLRKDGKLFARTDGPDNTIRDFEISYTFGTYPLQQYLIAMPGGRLQTLGIAWDARPAPAGQRWFHLYPSSRLRADDVQHWTSRSQNWNFMCAECHSTNVQKRYVEAEDRYETSWSDINVACEACHGPGSRHVTWARGRNSATAQKPDEDRGLTRLGAGDGATWQFAQDAAIASRTPPRTSHVELEMCARCHSRRSQFADDDQVGWPLAASHRPSLLEEGLYFADGQIRDEVYEYGSFLQSKMYAAGVTCSDCHEPHRPELPLSPDAVCSRCHRPSVFATPTHHRHKEGAQGSSCVGCHMAARTYMGIDVRRDHSFRVPRPDLTEKIGVPNACAGCHADRSAAWAAERVRAWYGSSRAVQSHYGEALAAGQSGAADAAPRLRAVLADPRQPAIVRATAVSLLRAWIDEASLPSVQQAARDADPLVRLAAVDVLSALPPGPRLASLPSLLGDSVRSVRLDAARALATIPDRAFGERDRTLLARGLSEWEAAQRFNADTAAAHLNLGALHADRGDLTRARTAYETARRLEPYFAPAAINLADVHRALGEDAEGERVLREAIGRTPEVAALHHALALRLVRNKDVKGAIVELRRAAELDPRDAGIAYTLAVALHDTGQNAAAIAALDRALRERPGDLGLLRLLIGYARETGDLTRAQRLAERLVQQTPDDPAAAALLAEIRRSVGRP